MKTIFYPIILLGLLISVASCEGYKCGAGVVKDKQTGVLLDSVYCEVTTGDATFYTDTSGKFSLCNKFGSCSFKCKDLTIRFSKTGYKPVSIDNPSGEETVYLER